ncbi:hypothetical protein HZ320_01065 [[Pasteurella] aerogenes]|nr:hypothetical protein HZ320_01065 [[Pasteurella] aerogenes]
MKTVILIFIGLALFGWISKIFSQKKKNRLPQNLTKPEPNSPDQGSDDCDPLIPVRKVFSAHPSLRTPLDILKLHGIAVSIDDTHYDEFASRGFGHWSNVYPDEVLSVITRSRIYQDNLDIEMLTEIREIYERNTIEPEKAWGIIKNICDNPKYKYSLSSSLGSEYIADFFYPRVLSFAIGIKQNQIDALIKFNICTIQQLEQSTDKTLLSIPGIGKKTLSALRLLQTENIPKHKERLQKDKSMWDGSPFLLEYEQER